MPPPFVPPSLSLLFFGVLCLTSECRR